jgi:hypothetical protein
MGLVHTTARLREGPVVAARPFITSASERCACVDVGERGGLSLYGPPDALPRLAAALVVAADAADALDRARSEPALTLVAETV